MIIKTYPGIPIYGDSKFRDKKCAKEDLEHQTFVNRIRTKYPESWGLLLIHPENERKLIDGQFSRVARSKAMGMTPGSSDIIIPGCPSFVCEIKRRDRTLSDLSREQHDYLKAAYNAGSFACIALGCDAAENAFNDWLKMQIKNPYQF